MTAHESFAEAAAAYALGALDREDTVRFEAHLATCTNCQQDLARYRPVVAGLGTGIEAIAEEPPAALRARVLARTTAQTRPDRRPLEVPETAPAPVHPPHGRSARTWPSMALAASLAAIVGLSVYAWQLRSANRSLHAELDAVNSQVRALLTELTRTGRELERWMKANRVVTEPDLLLVRLGGQAGAPSAVGRALLSPGRGLLVHATGLPPLAPGRVYQVWVIPPAGPSASAMPVGAGILRPDASGRFTLDDGSQWPTAASAVQAVAITAEPGPSGSPAPTTPILLAGRVEG